MYDTGKVSINVCLKPLFSYFQGYLGLLIMMMNTTIDD